MAFLNIFKKNKSAGEEKTRKKDKAEEEKRESQIKEETSQKIKAGESELADKFLLSPHITEQSTFLSEKGIYAFKVTPSANKILVKKAFKELYGITPRKVRIITVPSKKRFVGGKLGNKPGFKKAVIYLKKGDKIEFI